jgi:hypothetical protein
MGWKLRKGGAHMNKKKLIGIIAATIGVVAVSALLAWGMLSLVREKNVAETGNVLGIEWYDPAGVEFTISTKEELYDIASLSDFYTFEGQTIKLDADIVINEGNANEWEEKAPEEHWRPISKFAGTFDGQGHTISGVYGKGYETPMALFTHTDSSCVIQNLSLVNSCFIAGGNTGTASFASNGDGEFVKLYSDAIIVCNGERVGGIAGIIKSKASFDECWFDGSITVSGREGGGLVATILNGRVTMKHCLFSGELNSTYTFTSSRVGGICGRIEKTAGLNVTDTLVAGSVSVKNTGYAGTEIGVAFSGAQVVFTDSYDGAECAYEVAMGSGNSTGQIIQIDAQNLIGEKAYQWSTLDFEQYWAAVEGKTPELKAFADKTMDLSGVEKQYDLSWYDKNAFQFTITNAKQLYGFYIATASDNFKGKKVQLGADITINTGNAKDWGKTEPAYKWIPIGNNANPFMGTFDGQDHAISGMYFKDTNDVTTYNGFFGVCGPSSKVQNFKLTNSYFERTSDVSKAACMGSIVGETRGTVDGVYSDAIIVTNGQQVGGIVGRLVYGDYSFMLNPEVNNCWFDGSIIGATKYAGGIVGTARCFSSIKNPQKSIVTIKNCLNTGYITNDRTTNKDYTGGGQNIGGIIGNDLAKITLIVDNCFNAGTLDFKYTTYVGAIAGTKSNADSIFYISNCYGVSENYPRAMHGTINNGIGGGVVLPKAMLTGENGYRFTTLDFENSWTLTKEDTPMLKKFASTSISTSGLDKLVDFSWYQADKDTYVLDSVADFYGFAQLSTYNKFKGKIVKLGADIAVNKVDEATLVAWKDGSAPRNMWLAIGTTHAPFAGTFDGQGHTISGIYMKDTSEGTTYTGLFALTDIGSKLTNFKLTDSFFERSGNASNVAMVGSVVCEARGVIDSVYSNATIVTEGQQVGGIVSRLNYMDTTYATEVAVRDCWFDGEILGAGKYVGGVVGCVRCGSAIKEPTKAIARITNCLNTGYLTNERTTNKDKIGGGQYVGGIVGCDLGKVTYYIDGCVNAGEIDLIYQTYVGSILGSIALKESTCHITNSFGVKEDFFRGVYGVTGTLNGGVSMMPESILLGKGGYQYTTLDFDEHWAAVENGTPILKCFADEVVDLSGVKKMVDISWYQADKSVYTLETLEELYGFYLLSTYNKFKGKTIKLAADIAVNANDEQSVEKWRAGAETPESPWIPIGDTTYPFEGTFDGQGHTISGIYYKDTSKELTYTGFFGVAGIGSVVKDFRLVNSYFERTGQESYTAMAGTVAGESRGVIDTVYSNAVLVTDGQQVGGIVARLNYMDESYKTNMVVKNAWFDGEIIGGAKYVAGIAGVIRYGSAIKESLNTTTTITNCLNTGYITNARTTNKDEIGGGQYVAGILGTEFGASNVIISNCLNAGEIVLTYKTYAGAIVGSMQTAKSVYNITNTYGLKEVFEKNYGNNTSSSESVLDIEMLETSQATGYYAFISTDLNLAGKWLVAEGETPVLRDFAGERIALSLDIDWYKKNESPYVLKTAEELRSLEILVNGGITFDGETVQLGADIDLNEGWVPKVDANGNLQNVPVNVWKPLGTSESIAFKGTFTGFDGEKIHSISGIYVDENKRGTGFFGYVTGNGLVENVIFKNSYIVNKELRTGIVGWMQGNMNHVYAENSVHIKGAGQVGGLVGFYGASVTRKISESWYAGNVYNKSGQYVGGLVGWVYRGHKTIENSLFTGSVQSATTSNPRLGGLVGGTANNGSESSSATFVNSVSNGTLVTSATSQVGGVVGYVQGTVTVNIDNTYANVACTLANVYVLGSESMKGGNALLNMSLDFVTEDNNDGIWVATKEGPQHRIFSKEEVVKEANGTPIHKAWYYSKVGTTDAITYELQSLADFYGFAELVNTGVDVFEKDTVKLAVDIDLNPGWVPTVNANGELTNASGASMKWTPIGASKPFAGTFDGQGHTIKGIRVENTAQYAGLFALSTKTTVIKNFVMANSYIKSTQLNTGAVIGAFRGTLMENIKVSESVKIKGTGNLGGFVGILDSVSQVRTITGCWFAGEIYSTGQNIGGVFGRSWKGMNTVENTLITGTIHNTYSSTSNGIGLGGLGGAFDGYDSLTVKDCISLVTLNVKDGGFVSGAIGKVYYTYTATVEDVYEDATINLNGTDTTDNNRDYVVNGTVFDKDDFKTKSAKSVVGGIFKKSDNTENKAWVEVEGSYPVPAWTVKTK